MAPPPKNSEALLLVSALLFLISPAASAKCAFQVYKIDVVALDVSTNRPVPNAQIFLFENDESTAVALADENAQALPELRTDDAGVAHAQFWFSSYSGPGIFVSDKCNNRLHSLDVVVAAAGHQTSRTRVKFDRQTASKPSLPAVTVHVYRTVEPNTSPCEPTVTGPPNPSLQRTPPG